MEERLPWRPAVRSVVYRRAFKGVGPGPEEALWKSRKRPPVAPQRKSEGARVDSVKPRPRRGQAAGCMEERLPRSPAVRSVVYLRAFEDVLPCRACITRSCGGRGVFGVPAPLENKGDTGTRPRWQLRLNASRVYCSR
ncbi:unnamed protein product, partial [Ectocarpus sp. 6 AP-2014]